MSDLVKNFRSHLPTMNHSDFANALTVIEDSIEMNVSQAEDAIAKVGVATSDEDRDHWQLQAVDYQRNISELDEVKRLIKLRAASVRI